MIDVSDAPELIAACCMLHNVCEVHGDVFDEEWLNGVECEDLENSSSNSSSVQPTDSAVDIQNTFMSYLITKINDNCSSQNNMIM